MPEMFHFYRRRALHHHAKKRVVHLQTNPNVWLGIIHSSAAKSVPKPSECSPNYVGAQYQGSDGSKQTHASVPIRAWLDAWRSTHKRCQSSRKNQDGSGCYLVCHLYRPNPLARRHPLLSCLRSHSARQAIITAGIQISRGALQSRRPKCSYGTTSRMMPNVRLQPRRLRMAPTAVGCKPMLDRSQVQSPEIGNRIVARHG